MIVYRSVADEDLRALERRVRESPDDRALRHALVAALERSGERHRAYLELCKLAREHDDTVARGRMLAWNPWVSQSGWNRTRRSRSASLRRAPNNVRRATLDLPGARDTHPTATSSWILGATDERIVVGTSSRLASLTLSDLAVSWVVRNEGRRTVALIGESLLQCERASVDRDCVRRRDAATSEVLEEAVVEKGFIEALAVEGDRALLQVRARVPRGSGGRRGPHPRTARTIAMDLGVNFGRILWEREDVRVAASAGSRVVALVGGRLEALDVDDGRTLWSYTLRRADPRQNIRADENGVVIAEDGDDEYGEPGTLTELSLGGSVRWSSSRQGSFASHALGRSTVLLRDDYALRRRLLLDRRDGSEMCAIGEASVRWPATALDDETVYEAGWMEDETYTSRVNVRAWELATGNLIFQTVVDAGRPISNSMYHLELLPLERRLVLMIMGSGGKTTFIVLEE